MAEQRLDLKLQGKLVMTPQLQMAIKLLQMPTLDLHGFIGQELMENPFLKADDGTNESENTLSDVDSASQDSSELIESGTMGDENHDDFALENMYESASGGYDGPKQPLSDSGNWESTATKEETLRDKLTSQMGMATSDEKLQFLGSYLIDAIDDSGYLHLDLDEVASQLKVKKEKLEEALAIIHTFEPAGVGARGLAECLAIQLKQKKLLTEEAQAVLDNLELLAAQDFKKLAKRAGCDAEKVMEICESITELTPKPGLKYGSDVASNVIPDVVIQQKNSKWFAELNAEAVPKLLLSQQAQGLMGGANGDAKTYMNERFGRAQWLLKSLQQRAQTIHKVANAIVTIQEDFFNYGIESLQPLTLKQVAEIVDVHESTVSRVTNGKFMQTPMGVFELKYFFSSAINTTGGNVSIAAESVKSMIKRLIDAEDAKKPISDEKLVKFLKSEGVDVARRTVAKYREALGIPSSSGRRLRV